jgi:hypothetical protein
MKRRGPQRFPKSAEQVCPRQVKDGTRLLLCNALKPIKEFFQCFAGRQGIEEIFQRNARAVKAGRTAHAFGVDPDEAKQGVAGLNFVAYQELWIDRLDIFECRALGCAEHTYLAFCSVP